MISWKIILKRILRRIKNLFDSDIFSWKYESCENCGKCFRIAYFLKDKLWESVYGSENGCLCLDCFIRLAQSKNIKINKEDIEWLSMFVMDDYCEDIISIKE